jgi:hypothetical protein
MDMQSTTPRRPFFRGSPVFGLIFVLAGCLVLYLFGQVPQLSCTRPDANNLNCVLKTSLLGLYPLRTAEVDGLQKARVGQDCTGTDCTYRVELVRTDGVTPMTSFYSNGLLDKQTTSKKINGFIQNSESKNFVVTIPLNPLVLVFAVLFAGAGVYAMFVPMRPGHGYHY